MNIKEAVSYGTGCLQQAGIGDAGIDAFLLFEAVTGFGRTEFFLHPDRELSPGQFEKYKAYIKRRAGHEPCQYITGSCGFYGLDFLVNEHVLIPRQDTETLVEEALRCADKNAAVLDLCTGSGAIAVAMKSQRPDLSVLAVDISASALAVAEGNAQQNHCEIRFQLSDLFSGIDPAWKFNLIVSNPPYISETEFASLMPEVKDFEPSLALKAGKDGLDIYRRLIAEAPQHLVPGGRLLVEIGSTQAAAVTALFRQTGFEEIELRKDLAGLERVVGGKLPETCGAADGQS